MYMDKPKITAWMSQNHYDTCIASQKAPMIIKIIHRQLGSSLAIIHGLRAEIMLFVTDVPLLVSSHVLPILPKCKSLAISLQETIILSEFPVCVYAHVICHYDKFIVISSDVCTTFTYMYP